MGQILTAVNLQAYFDWAASPWRAADLLYERVPMLAIRSYITEGKGANWPLCWTKGRALDRGLALCINFLRDWQAFRPGSARDYQADMEKVVPRVVMRFQKDVATQLKAVGAIDVCKHDEKTAVLTRLMTRAVGEISALKRLDTPTPMLGSKVMHFFFPEFFPI